MANRLLFVDAATSGSLQRYPILGAYFSSRLRLTKAVRRAKEPVLVGKAS
jgi:hypothetical protein